jgi:cation transport regulator ChaC
MIVFIYFDIFFSLQPGRVATLVKSEHGCTWGIAYQVDPHDVPEVMNYLNKREAGGYTTHEMEFYSNESIKQDFIVLTYIGTESNPNYIGPEPAEASAKIIVKSQGASGSNIEYVLELEKAMKEIAPHIVDEHLQDITKNIKQLSNKI